MIGYDRTIRIGEGEDEIKRHCRVVSGSGSLLVDEATGTSFDFSQSLEIHWERGFLGSALVNKFLKMDGDEAEYKIEVVRDPNGQRRTLILDLTGK